jgi:signal transduction histidine kinase
VRSLGHAFEARSNQTRFRQSLLNLASNANKFTEKGTITIAAHQGQENGRDWITLAVTDTGIGMTQEQMDKLFQEFAQASSTTARHWPWSRDQPPVLSDDGRRYHCGKQAGQGLDLHDPVAEDCGCSQGNGGRSTG